MNAHDTIKQTYGFSQMVLQGYLADLSDQELLERPGEGCNHIAWQLGHLIHSEGNLLNMVVPNAAVELSDDFVAHHAKENAASNDPSQFCTKAEYMDLFSRSQAATFAALDGLSESDLDQPGPEAMQNFCPTVGSMFVLIATHVMMHVGQVVPVRRRLGKAVVM